MLKIKSWWNNLLISRKMYLLCGVSAVLISFELVILVFAVNTLSPLRALVAGEGKWSKSQKNAIIHLQEYVNLKNPGYYDLFLKELEVPLANYRARVELERDNVNYTLVGNYLSQGGAHSSDVAPMIRLLKNFNNFPFLDHAIRVWKEADGLLAEIITQARVLKEEMSKPTPSQNKVTLIMSRISELNHRLTRIENDFSETLGVGSRFLESAIIVIMFFVVLLVECLIFYLLFKFCEKFAEEIKKLNMATIRIGQGDFSTMLQSKSEDELGQMAVALNTMIKNLRHQVTERENAEHANQVKNLFLANISHEIRTPLNSILGFNEILRDPQLSCEERNYYLDIVKRTGLTLTSIINDILDLSRIEAEHLAIEKTTFSLSQLLEDLYLTMKLRCEEKGIILKFRKIGQVSEYIYTDPIRLRQVLTNLIGNSIKFTERGEILLDCSVVDGRLEFLIQDTGVGMQKKQIEKLFVPFSQGDESINKKFGGTGLGLVISKKLAQLLGGDVEIVRTEVGVGSELRFYIAYQVVDKLPKDTSDLVVMEKKNLSYLAGKRILVAEDTIDNQVLIKIFLSKLGLNLTFVNNGQEALREVEKKSFDLIMMDMQMPIMDGYTAVKALREKGVTLPVVAMTGFSMKGDKKKCLDAGCDLYISKPFSKEEIIDIVYRSLVPAAPISLNS